MRLDFYSCPVHTCASPSRVTGSWSRQDLDVYVMDSIWQILGVEGVSTQHHRVNSHRQCVLTQRSLCWPLCKLLGFQVIPGPESWGGSSHGYKPGALILLSFYCWGTRKNLDGYPQQGVPTPPPSPSTLQRPSVTVLTVASGLSGVPTSAAFPEQAGLSTRSQVTHTCSHLGLFMHRAKAGAALYSTLRN